MSNPVRLPDGTVRSKATYDRNRELLEQSAHTKSYGYEEMLKALMVDDQTFKVDWEFEDKLRRTKQMSDRAQEAKLFAEAEHTTVDFPVNSTTTKSAYSVAVVINELHNLILDLQAQITELQEAVEELEGAQE